MSVEASNLGFIFLFTTVNEEVGMNANFVFKVAWNDAHSISTIRDRHILKYLARRHYIASDHVLQLQAGS